MKPLREKRVVEMVVDGSALMRGGGPKFGRRDGFKNILS